MLSSYRSLGESRGARSELNVDWLGVVQLRLHRGDLFDVVGIGVQHVIEL